VAEITVYSVNLYNGNNNPGFFCPTLLTSTRFISAIYSIPHLILLQPLLIPVSQNLPTCTVHTITIPHLKYDTRSTHSLQFTSFTYLIIYSIEHSPSLETNRPAASQRFLSFHQTIMFNTTIICARHLSLS
jgi:hypothetical protein